MTVLCPADCAVNRAVDPVAYWKHVVCVHLMSGVTDEALLDASRALHRWRRNLSHAKRVRLDSWRREVSKITGFV